MAEMIMTEKGRVMFDPNFQPCFAVIDFNVPETIGFKYSSTKEAAIIWAKLMGLDEKFVVPGVSCCFNASGIPQFGTD